MKKLLLAVLLTVALIADIKIGDTYTCVSYDEANSPILIDINIRSKSVAWIGENEVPYSSTHRDGSWMYMYKEDLHDKSGTVTSVWFINLKADTAILVDIENNNNGELARPVSSTEFDCSFKSKGTKGYNPVPFRYEN